MFGGMNIGGRAAKVMDIIKLPAVGGQASFVDASFVETFRGMKDFICMPMSGDGGLALYRVCALYRPSAIVCLSENVGSNCRCHADLVTSPVLLPVGSLCCINADSSRMCYSLKPICGPVRGNL